MDTDSLINELIEREGGYVNHPADRGGPTRFGITEAVARAHGYAGTMAALPREEAVAIYRRLYWLRPRFNAIAKRRVCGFGRRRRRATCKSYRLDQVCGSLGSP